jgi:thiol-disulfide isomerase/thioredoxin
MSNNNDIEKITSTYRRLFIPLAVLLAIAGIYAMFGGESKQQAQKPEQQQEQQQSRQAQKAQVAPGALNPALATGAMKNLVIHAKPKPLPEIVFYDRHGKEHRMSEFRGKPVMINFWASWCPPCRKEMPEIAKLQEKYLSRGFTVLAISEDYKGYDWAWQALRTLGAQNLELFMDTGQQAIRQIDPKPALPITILVNRHGEEVARLTGPADWFAPQAQAVIEALLAQK